MRNKINIKELENLLDNNKDKTTKELALIIKEFTKNNEITEETTETYEIYQIKQDFEDIEESLVAEVKTDDIEKTMNEFCEEMGETFMFNEETMTCYDDYGNEFEFRKI